MISKMKQSKWRGSGWKREKRGSKILYELRCQPYPRLLNSATVITMIPKEVLFVEYNNLNVVVQAREGRRLRKLEIKYGMEPFIGFTLIKMVCLGKAELLYPDSYITDVKRSFFNQDTFRYIIL